MSKEFKAGGLAMHQQDCFIVPRPVEELYNVNTDPYQLINLAGQPDYEIILSKMRSNLDRWILDYDDKIPVIPTPDRFDRWTGKRIEP